MSELDDLREHLERYRAVTLQCLDLVTDEDLGWRPGPDHFTLGQQFLHIAQAEDFQVQGVLFGDWDYDRARFPGHELGVEDLRERLTGTRSRTLAALDEFDEAGLEEPVTLKEGEPAGRGDEGEAGWFLSKRAPWDRTRVGAHLPASPP